MFSPKLKRPSPIDFDETETPKKVARHCNSAKSPKKSSPRHSNYAKTSTSSSNSQNRKAEVDSSTPKSGGANNRGKVDIA